MAKEKKDKKKKKGDEPKPDVYLNFMGSKLLVRESEEGGYVHEADVPRVRGAALNFSNWSGEVPYKTIKVRFSTHVRLSFVPTKGNDQEKVKDKFERVPYIKHEKGENKGLLGFERALSEDDLAFVREALSGLGGDDVVWAVAEGQFEQFSLSFPPRLT